MEFIDYMLNSSFMRFLFLLVIFMCINNISNALGKIAYYMEITKEHQERQRRDAYELNVLIEKLIKTIQEKR